MLILLGVVWGGFKSTPSTGAALFVCSFACCAESCDTSVSATCCAQALQHTVLLANSKYYCTWLMQGYAVNLYVVRLVCPNHLFIDACAV